MQDMSITKTLKEVDATQEENAQFVKTVQGVSIAITTVELVACVEDKYYQQTEIIKNKRLKYMRTLLLFTMLMIGSSVLAQARLTIENKSMRDMTVKVMKNEGDSDLHQELSIAPYSTETVYFSSTGYYFCKTKAVIKGKTPIYQKGEPFRVVNDNTGYSVMTLTFSIKESKFPQITGGKTISKAEFDKN